MLKNKLPEEKISTLLNTSQLAIIDLVHMGTEECPVKSVVVRVAEQLKKALTEKGLAVLVNHGIPEDKLKTAWGYLDEFCDLPTEIKDVYLKKTGTNHGYVKPNQEKFDGMTSDELRHAFNICTLSGASLPEEPLPGFKDHVADLAKDFKNLSSLLLQALSIALELPLNYFLDRHSAMLSSDGDENDTTLRLLYYPALVEDDNKHEILKRNLSYSYQKCASHKLHLDKIVDDDEEETELPPDDLKKHRGLTKCGAHCDYGTFTLLAQDAESGLECKLPGSGKWQRVGHLPGSILINTGELLSLWTNEQFPALPHRVIVPEQALVRSKGRHSIAFFVHPDNDKEIVPLQCPSKMVTDSVTAENGEGKKKKSFHTKMMSAFRFKQSNPS